MHSSFSRRTKEKREMEIEEQVTGNTVSANTLIWQHTGTLGVFCADPENKVSP